MCIATRVHSDKVSGVLANVGGAPKTHKAHSSLLSKTRSFCQKRIKLKSERGEIGKFVCALAGQRTREEPSAAQWRGAANLVKRTGGSSFWKISFPCRPRPPFCPCAWILTQKRNLYTMPLFSASNQSHLLHSLIYARLTAHCLCPAKLAGRRYIFPSSQAGAEKENEKELN